MTMSTVVTGGAGFIGSHLVSRLLQSGREVVVADNLQRGSRQNLIDADVDKSYAPVDLRRYEKQTLETHAYSCHSRDWISLFSVVQNASTADFVVSITLSHSKTEITDSIEKIEQPIVREALRLLNVKDYLEMVFIADIPGRSAKTMPLL
jgi:NAD(P)-dependent dehydrogenase (short-subunit alcohol dehydrogenase family)